MHNKLITLYNLQIIDSRLHQIELSKEGLPQLVNEIQSEIDTENQNVRNFEESVNKLHTHLASTERLIDESKKVMDNSKERRTHVTNNKEYEALINEMAFHEKQLADSESQKILLTKESEKNSDAIAKARLNIQELEAKLVKSREQLAAKLAETVKEESELLAERTKLIADLPNQIIKLYERIYKAKNCLAVVKSDDGSCSGCHTRLPSAKLSELKRYDSIVMCDVCSRILTLGFSKDSVKK